MPAAAPPPSRRQPPLTQYPIWPPPYTRHHVDRAAHLQTSQTSPISTSLSSFRRSNRRDRFPRKQTHERKQSLRHVLSGIAALSILTLFWPTQRSSSPNIDLLRWSSFPPRWPLPTWVCWHQVARMFRLPSTCDLDPPSDSQYSHLRLHFASSTGTRPHRLKGKRQSTSRIRLFYSRTLPHSSCSPVLSLSGLFPDIETT